MQVIHFNNVIKIKNLVSRLRKRAGAIPLEIIEPPPLPVIQMTVRAISPRKKEDQERQYQSTQNKLVKKLNALQAKGLFIIPVPRKQATIPIAKHGIMDNIGDMF